MQPGVIQTRTGHPEACLVHDQQGWLVRLEETGFLGLALVIEAHPRGVGRVNAAAHTATSGNELFARGGGGGCG